MKAIDRRRSIRFLVPVTLGLCLPALAGAQVCNIKVVTDEETARGWNCEPILETPVSARYVKYKIRPRRAVCVIEVQALKFIRYEPFDIRIALPDDS